MRQFLFILIFALAAHSGAALAEREGGTRGGGIAVVCFDQDVAQLERVARSMKETLPWQQEAVTIPSLRIPDAWLEHLQSIEVLDLGLARRSAGLVSGEPAEVMEPGERESMEEYASRLFRRNFVPEAIRTLLEAAIVQNPSSSFRAREGFITMQKNADFLDQGFANKCALTTMVLQRSARRNGWAEFAVDSRIFHDPHHGPLSQYVTYVHEIVLSALLAMNSVGNGFAWGRVPEADRQRLATELTATLVRKHLYLSDMQPMIELMRIVYTSSDADFRWGFIHDPDLFWALAVMGSPLAVCRANPEASPQAYSSRPPSPWPQQAGSEQQQALPEMQQVAPRVNSSSLPELHGLMMLDYYGDGSRPIVFLANQEIYRSCNPALRMFRAQEEACRQASAGGLLDGFRSFGYLVNGYHLGTNPKPESKILNERVIEYTQGCYRRHLDRYIAPAILRLKADPFMKRAFLEHVREGIDSLPYDGYITTSTLFPRELLRLRRHLKIETLPNLGTSSHYFTTPAIRYNDMYKDLIQNLRFYPVAGFEDTRQR